MTLHCPDLIVSRRTRDLRRDARHPTARQIGRRRDREWLDRHEAGESIRTLAILYHAGEQTVRDGIARAKALREEIARVVAG